MPSDPNSLIGYWRLASASASPQEIGVTHLRFTTDGVMQEGNENESRIYILSFQYWIAGDSIATICLPNPRIELTKFAIAAERMLILSVGDHETTWSRSEKQAFFESNDFWDPGILFDRQVNYMSLLNSQRRSYQIERAAMLGISPEVLVNTDALWKCWKYGRARFASFHLEDFNQILARHVLIDDEDNESRTLLTYLAEDGNTQAVRKVFEYGADVNHKDVHDLTALDYATLADRHETADLLSTLGAIHGPGFSE